MHWYEWFFWIVWSVGFLILAAYGISLLMGAPYLPTMKQARVDALKLLDLKPGEVLVDLGSGDGSLLILAAERGLKAIGYEINPFLWLISKVRTFRFGHRVTIKFKSFWRADISKADGVFVFLITHRMVDLDNYLASVQKPLRVVSHAFKIPGKKVLKQQGALFLYIYK